MKAKTICAALVVLMAVVLVLAGCSSKAPSGGTGGSSGGNSVTVSLVNKTFDPSNIEVAAGGSVKFVNNDSVPHDIVGEGWDSGQLAPGASYSQTFPTAGTYAIHCSIHPYMQATVVVK